MSRSFFPWKFVASVKEYVCSTHAGFVPGNFLVYLLARAQDSGSLAIFWLPSLCLQENRKGDKSQDTDSKESAIYNRLVSGGQGPPVPLLHGNPQAHAMWNKIALRLAKEFTVVAAHLRGYGDSSKPPDGENHSNHSKRAMALDQTEVMSHFGFEKFAVVGHDRSDSLRPGILSRNHQYEPTFRFLRSLSSVGIIFLCGSIENCRASMVRQCSLPPLTTRYPAARKIAS